ncbi:voltage-dependent calcium channel gamma-3 subunit-like protein [Pitangus sulphuratus]|nr:voltage-dependent calcium channel gamma-3 subunit-like protein [Pitangus sulphuratus]
MRMCDRGVQMLVTTVGAFAAFSLMTIAVGTDYWLYSRGVCRTKSTSDNDTSRKNEEVMTHSGLWRTCCLEGLSNIIGIIVYISANAGDPGQSDSKKSYSYGWSFYFGALSFIIAEMVGVIAVHMYIEKHRQIRARSHSELLKKSAFTRLPPYRYRFRRRSSSRSTEPRSRDMSPISKGFSTIPSTDISMFTLSRDPSKVTMGTLLNSERDHGFLQVHNSIPKEFKESLHNNPANRRTTPV